VLMGTFSATLDQGGRHYRTLVTSGHRRRTAITGRQGWGQGHRDVHVEVDAEAWPEMLETLLQHRLKVTFDWATLAGGLAQTVRSHGGAYTATTKG
jgi:hypothetical protein